MYDDVGMGEIGETTLIDVEDWEGIGVVAAVGVVGDCGRSRADELDGTELGIEAVAADASAKWADAGVPAVPSFEEDAAARSSVIV